MSKRNRGYSLAAAGLALLTACGVNATPNSTASAVPDSKAESGLSPSVSPIDQGASVSPIDQGAKGPPTHAAFDLTAEKLNQLSPKTTEYTSAT